MVDKIDMALEDIIKAGKRGRGGGGAGRKFDIKNSNRGGGSFRGNNRSGGVMRGKNRGGISKQANYTRVNFKVSCFIGLHINKIWRTSVLFYHNR